MIVLHCISSCWSSQSPTNHRTEDLVKSHFRQSLKTFSFGKWNQSAVWTPFNCALEIILLTTYYLLLTYLPRPCINSFEVELRCLEIYFLSYLFTCLLIPYVLLAFMLHHVCNRRTINRITILFRPRKTYKAPLLVRPSNSFGQKTISRAFCLPASLRRLGLFSTHSSASYKVVLYLHCLWFFTNFHFMAPMLPEIKL